MVTVVNLRGTSGSGKSTVVRGIMSQGKTTPLFVTGNVKPEAYHIVVPKVPHPIYALGNYEQTCGGMDTVSKQDDICNLIRKYANKGHVLVEGLLMSHLFSRYASLDHELQAKDVHFIWAFLDTPLELCLDRVAARREIRRMAKVNPPPFKPLNPENTSSKWHDMRRVFEKCKAENPKDWKLVQYPIAILDARWVEHQKAVEQVLGWLSKPDLILGDNVTRLNSSPPKIKLRPKVYG